MWWRVFSANLDWEAFRPAHWVLMVGLAVTLAAFLWSLRPQRAGAPAKARKASPRAPSGVVQVQSGS